MRVLTVFVLTQCYGAHELAKWQSRWPHTLHYSALTWSERLEELSSHGVAGKADNLEPELDLAVNPLLYRNIGLCTPQDVCTLPNRREIVTGVLAWRGSGTTSKTPH